MQSTFKVRFLMRPTSNKHPAKDMFIKQIYREWVKYYKDSIDIPGSRAVTWPIYRDSSFKEKHI